MRETDDRDDSLFVHEMDFRHAKAKPGTFKSFPHSLRFDKLHVWPKLITVKYPDNENAGYHLQIPDFFLSLTRNEFPPEWYEDGNRLFKAAKPFFNLFYDRTPYLIYMRQYFRSTEKPLFPLYNASARGITWARLALFKRQRRNLETLDKSQLDPDWWLEDIV